MFSYLMKRIRNIRLQSTTVVAIVMIVFSWAIAFGPNTREASGSVAYIQTALGISPVQIALVASLGAGLILALNLKGVKFLLAASPISAFYAIVVMYTLNQGFSLATPAFSMMAYLYLLRAAKE